MLSRPQRAPYVLTAKEAEWDSQGAKWLPALLLPCRAALERRGACGGRRPEIMGPTVFQLE